jgi:ferric iron reductase protein FhuF
MAQNMGETGDIGDLIVAATAKRYSAYCRGRHLMEAPADADVVACSALLDEREFEQTVARFCARYPTTTDRRALISLWSLHYFSSLVITPAIAFLELGRILPLSIEETGLLIDRQSGTPRGFKLVHCGHVDHEADVLVGLRPAIRGHLDILIPQLASFSKLSRKTFWTNASAYLSWIVDEVGRHADASRAEAMRAVTETAIWPDGWRNPLAGMVRVERTENGDYVGNRRVCCLRYCVPGVGGCGAICPVPEGRAPQVSAVA